MQIPSDPGFWVTLIGTGATLWGLFLTYRLAEKALTETELVARTVNDLNLEISQYDAFRDIGAAGYALDATKKLINNGSWRDASDSYDDARQSLFRVRTHFSLSTALDQRCGETIKQMQRFCENIDTAIEEGTPMPQQNKAREIIRKNIDFLEELKKEVREAQQ